MKVLKTVEDVIKALGGNTKAAMALGEKPNTVGNWQTRGSFPAEQLLNVSGALMPMGMAAHISLFGMKSTKAA